MALFDDEFLKKIEYLYVMSKKVFAGQKRAERKTKKTATGLEFADHRNYAPGDDFRSLDWKIYGRTEKLLIRLFEEKEDLAIYFLLDCSASMQSGGGAKFDYARRMAAALAFIGLSNMDRVSLVAFRQGVVDRMPLCSGRGQIYRVFHFLEKLEAKEETAFEESFKTFAAQNHRRGVAVVLSDLYNPGGYEQALNFLHFQQFETYVLHLTDPEELKSVGRGDVDLMDSETGERLSMTLTPKVHQQLREAFEAYCLEVEAYCSRRQMLYARLPIDMALDDVVLKIFRQGGFLK